MRCYRLSLYEEQWRILHFFAAGQTSRRGALNTKRGPIYTVSQKNCANLTMAITLSIFNRFVNFFHCCKKRQISSKIHISFPTTPSVCCRITLGNLQPFAWTHSWRHYRHCNWPVEKASPGMCPCKWWTF